MSWQKWISALLLVPVVGYVVLCLGVYLWGAGALPADRQPNTGALPPSMRAQFQAIHGVHSDGAVRLNPLTAPWYFFRQSAGTDELRLPAWAGRTLLQRSDRPVGGTRRVAADIAATIFVSRAWSIDEQVNTVLNEGFYGRGAHGLPAAAKAWYGQSPETLWPEEFLALQVLDRGPSFYDPVCYPKRFEERFRFVSAHLNIPDIDTALARARERLRAHPSACNSASAPATTLLPFPVSNQAA